MLQAGRLQVGREAGFLTHQNGDRTCVLHTVDDPRPFAHHFFKVVCEVASRHPNRKRRARLFQNRDGGIHHNRPGSPIRRPAHWRAGKQPNRAQGDQRCTRKHLGRPTDLEGRLMPHSFLLLSWNFLGIGKKGLYHFRPSSRQVFALPGSCLQADQRSQIPHRTPRRFNLGGTPIQALIPQPQTAPGGL